jgi:hypothetical protein
MNYLKLGIGLLCAALLINSLIGLGVGYFVAALFGALALGGVYVYKLEDKNVYYSEEGHRYSRKDEKKDSKVA